MAVVEIGEFPRPRKRAAFQPDEAYVMDVDGARPLFGGGDDPE